MQLDPGASNILKRKQDALNRKVTSAEQAHKESDEYHKKAARTFSFKARDLKPFSSKAEKEGVRKLFIENQKAVVSRRRREAEAAEARRRAREWSSVSRLMLLSDHASRKRPEESHRIEMRQR